MPDKTRHIRKQFPDKKNTLDLLMAKDPEFLSLCEDYNACVDALHFWAESKAPEAEIRLKEYSNFCRELEEEVAEALNELKKR